MNQANGGTGINLPVPVITKFHSARARPERFSSNLQVLEKPFDPDRLADAISKIFQAG